MPTTNQPNKVCIDCKHWTENHCAMFDRNVFCDDPADDCEKFEEYTDAQLRADLSTLRESTNN